MINEKEMFDIISNDIINEQKNNSFYLLENFNFHDVNTHIVLIFSNDKDTYLFNCKTINYSDLFYHCILFTKPFPKDKLLDLIKFLFDFRKNYSYSKILDKIIPNETFEFEEKKKTAIINFTTLKPVDKCCVCLEYNIVLTPCKHNLCRVCYYNIKIQFDDIDDDIKGYKLCPLCRGKI